MREDIATELGADIDIGALTLEQQSALVAAIREARANQRAELQSSIDAALEHVPRLLRGALRKVLFP